MHRILWLIHILSITLKRPLKGPVSRGVSDIFQTFSFFSCVVRKSIKSFSALFVEAETHEEYNRWCHLADQLGIETYARGS